MATRSETKPLVPAKKGALRDMAGYPSLRDVIVGLLQSARQTVAASQELTQMPKLTGDQREFWAV